MSDTYVLFDNLPAYGGDPKHNLKTDRYVFMLFFYFFILPNKRKEREMLKLKNSNIKKVGMRQRQCLHLQSPRVGDIRLIYA